MLKTWQSAANKAAAWWKQTPVPIKTAIFLLLATWAAYAMFLASLQKTIPAPTSTRPITGLLIEATLLAQLGFGLYVIALIGRKHASGRLIILIGFIGLSVLRIVQSIKLHFDTGTAVFLMLGAACVLLFTHESRVWFRTRGTQAPESISTMKFNLRKSVPILNNDTPVTIKIAAFVFLVTYFISLHFLVDVVQGAFLLSAKHFSISPKISNGTLRTITLLTIVPLVVWALVKGFLIAKLFFRRRWAKNVLSVVTVLIFLVILWVHTMQPKNASLTLSSNLEHVAEVIAVALLCTPRSRTWFQYKT